MEDYMYPYTMIIDGARAGTDQHWRISRIHMILGYAQALADIENNEDYYKKIKSVFDDKGTLFVTWLSEPTENEKEYVHKAWVSIVTDYEGNDIVHDIL